MTDQEFYEHMTVKKECMAEIGQLVLHLTYSLRKQKGVGPKSRYSDDHMRQMVADLKNNSSYKEHVWDVRSPSRLDTLLKAFGITPHEWVEKTWPWDKE